ncbi:hypothetical protein DL95DRAFT_391742 [Leptodontidium sp. 2 PMI_412]|nr:hypothetical protein DL95DRAFT_391742 [Leptodontidium sp. 2 PMI_412]
MRFIAANTNIPIPRVYDEGTESAPSITMGYIEGERLDKVWNGLPEEEKLDIADQLKGILSELRSLKGEYIGSLHCGKAIDGRRFGFEGGPFDTEEEFNRFLLSDTFSSTAKILRDIAFRSLQRDHELVFTHCDSHPGISSSKTGGSLVFWIGNSRAGIQSTGNL